MKLSLGRNERPEDKKGEAREAGPWFSSPVLEPLLGVHSAPDAAWLVDAAPTAAERGLGALYSLLYLSDGSGRLCGERPASSERMQGLAKLNQELGVNLPTLKFHPPEL